MSTTAFTTQRLRRYTMGAALILFPALLAVEEPLDPAEGGTGEVMYTAASQHRGTLVASAILLLISAVLMAPAVAGILHQARDRGAGLANLAAVVAVLGGFGHAAIAMFYFFALPLARGDRTQMVAYIERLNASPVLSAVAFPLILCFGLGILAMAWAAWRAGIIGLWGPIAVTTLVLAHELLPDPPSAVDLVGVVGLTAVFGQLGLQMLRMTDGQWSRIPQTAAAPVPAHA